MMKYVIHYDSNTVECECEHSRCAFIREITGLDDRGNLTFTPMFPFGIVGGICLRNQMNPVYCGLYPGIQ